MIFGNPKVRVAMLVASLLAASCDSPPPAEYEPHVTEEDQQLGAEQHPLLLEEFGGSYEGPEAAYVSVVGAKLASAAGLQDQCTFTLVNTDVVNAFAVPGCYIYVTRGLMGIVNSEAELASVLGHELGHIVAAHSRRQEERSLWRTLGVLAVGLITGSEQLTRIAGRAAEFFTLRYSRQQEYEADDLGIRYLRQAGYDPYASPDMLDALARQEQYQARTGGHDEARSIPEWARTHPLTENRIERARDEAGASGIAPDDLPEGEAAYLREVDDLLYGDDPEQGFVRGRSFAHPMMRIAFEAPKGFTLTNSPRAILIEGPDGMRGEFGGGRLPPAGLEAYVTALMKQLLGDAQAAPGPAERTRVNGLPAIFVPALVPTEQGTVRLRIAAYEGGDGEAYHFIMISPPGKEIAPALGALFRSFRLLPPDEAARLKPRRIKVVTAGPGDTSSTLAARMASEQPLGTFLMLNGRSAGQPLRSGDRVKIVTFAAP